MSERPPETPLLAQSLHPAEAKTTVTCFRMADGRCVLDLFVFTEAEARDMLAWLKEQFPDGQEAPLSEVPGTERAAD